MFFNTNNYGINPQKASLILEMKKIMISRFSLLKKIYKKY